ncbi:abortive phage infection protein [Paenibacillus riograndensis]|uniref:Abortive phage infection protein n=1 Tax=Paenibacillus riograndensis TaxID=483937 RepID=A0A132TLE9_9BACL|nr:ATP-binding protein [Paenibacillus riograndensis]KWX72187.1 abortive phage infection protein [Paenibacillus riograndensis]
MLLEFRTKNFKSFQDELIFSLTPAPKQKGLDYSLLKEKNGSKEYKGLSSAVIYGPNASGKTNIIGAMDVLKSIILRGHIRNEDKKSKSNAAASTLELIPNSADKSKTPVDFSIKFTDSGLMFEYKLSLDLGSFLEEGYNRKVLSEVLRVNEKLIFSRNPSLDLGDTNLIRKYAINGFEENENSVRNLAKKNLIDDELFLMNGFKAMFSLKLVNIITNWLEDKFMVFCRADALQARPSTSKKDTIYINTTINDAARIFGINSNALGYHSSDEDSEPKLYSILDNKGIVQADSFESFGTIRFVNMFPIVIDALLSGGTLVIDEFDASLHPMALMSIVNIFHNDDLNTQNAQLIFNTHNPIFLNSNLFRRDEIKFVERDEETFSSIHYSLSDFGTSGEKAVRQGGDYMKNYFISQYGAIKDVDFTSVFEKLLETRREL